MIARPDCVGSKGLMDLMLDAFVTDNAWQRHWGGQTRTATSATIAEVGSLLFFTKATLNHPKFEITR